MELPIRERHSRANTHEEIRFVESDTSGSFEGFGAVAMGTVSSEETVERNERRGRRDTNSNSSSESGEVEDRSRRSKNLNKRKRNELQDLPCSEEVTSREGPLHSTAIDGRYCKMPDLVGEVNGHFLSAIEQTVLVHDELSSRLEELQIGIKSDLTEISDILNRRINMEKSDLNEKEESDVVPEGQKEGNHSKEAEATAGPESVNAFEGFQADPSDAMNKKNSGPETYLGYL